MGIKKTLRMEQLAKRKELSLSYRQTAEKTMLTKLIAMPEYQKSEMIFCYIGMEEEINTWQFIEYFLSDNKRVCVPKVVAPDEMELREIMCDSCLVRSSFGVLEPTEENMLVNSKSVDLVLVPCITANRQGDRLGYGGGFYDRFLKESQAMSVLCIWKKMLFDAIPVEEHDVKVKKVITE
ncbi:5-formyltetrahydrofolate cyclo-ligase [Vagococcus xieshaowenii]|uniref:5-formyltetrahydrofolate cyclo-ligase n=1 Tax=Vagococcus xieshaowenii TaxID=2562451 RepID=A0AAJ5EFQ0_9ENTE|nr:5-formyltetrahydrofolate cyclo-ligase [Vagococcus xieshaowenii]QCA28785.1 5-formyltetrahydrofolate cyclo-ligase [Vagococcus xieshaowenii]TFZ43014.1 5-formyltetrahydrofolate cyclo-ligase [Vagococcus xieshaowenii]